ncbi:MAG TPA: hypothetical protein VID48_14155 [Solirubrobacteraceae bacterium]
MAVADEREFGEVAAGVGGALVAARRDPSRRRSGRPVCPFISPRKTASALLVDALDRQLGDARPRDAHL